MRFFAMMLVIAGFSRAFSDDGNLQASQIETTPLIREIVRNFEGLQSPRDLKALRFVMMYNLEQRRCSAARRGHEQRIRWQRSASRIFEDAFIYRDRGDADLAVAYLALCKALGVDGRFVKVWRGGEIYSLAEIEIGNVWYVYDVAANGAEPVPGTVTAEKGFQGWRLWRKGRDSWDIGLRKGEDIEKMNDVIDCQVGIRE